MNRLIGTLPLIGRIPCHVLAACFWIGLGGTLLSAQTSDFQSLFDGKTLNGWQAQAPDYWSVQDGAITAEITAEHPCETNQYLIWEGGELADFELRVTSRVTGAGNINNGFQFRSRRLPDGDVCGYQVDNNLGTDWLVRLYDEYGRHDLALRGQRTQFAMDGKRTTTELPQAQGAPWFQLEQWHDYHLTCIGSSIRLRVDDRLVAEVDDQDARRAETQGILALQLHSGPATRVQFKNIELKEIQPANSPRPEPAFLPETLLQDAVAVWRLDTGGHGARPRLQLIPAFYQFELNVKADGTAALPDEKVLLLDGACMEAGDDLRLGPDALTWYLRARDPNGSWQGTLLSRQDAEQVNFEFSSSTFPSEAPELQVRLRTDQGLFTLVVPLEGKPSDRWRDWVILYNGKHLSLFCDGQRLAEVPASGKILAAAEPLTIGAKRTDDGMAQPFRGELSKAVFWNRALSAKEMRLLSISPQSPPAR